MVEAERLQAQAESVWPSSLPKMEDEILWIRERKPDQALGLKVSHLKPQAVFEMIASW